MTESIDLSLEDSFDEANTMERRDSIDLDELQMAQEKKSVDSIMLEVCACKFFKFVMYSHYLFNFRNHENMVIWP